MSSARRYIFFFFGKLSKSLFDFFAGVLIINFTLCCVYLESASRCAHKTLQLLYNLQKICFSFSKKKKKNSFKQFLMINLTASYGYLIIFFFWSTLSTKVGVALLKIRRVKKI